MSYGEEFRYSVLSSELVVGEIYVRVYNEQPTFTLEVHYTYIVCLVLSEYNVYCYRMLRALQLIFLPLLETMHRYYV